MTLISEDYGFYAGFLKFIALKTEKNDVNVHVMMSELDQAAQQIETGQSIELLTSRAPVASRAFAGVAQFLQHRILPEAQAHGDEKVLKQLEWAIAASLQIGRAMILFADKMEKNGQAEETIQIELPPLDRIPGLQENQTSETLH